MNGELAGRHVLVAGAGGGLGSAVVLELAAQGCELTIMGRTGAALRTVAARAAEHGARCAIEIADATDPDDVARAVENAERRAPLWGCVNAVGINRTGPTVDYAVELFDAVLGSSVRSAFLLCQAVGARLLAHGGGRIVNISSQMGSVGYPGRAAYCAAKHAVNGLTKALAVEWAPGGVTVNAVGPTFVETAMTAGALGDPDFKADVMRRLPIGRLGTPGEVAGAVAHLLMPRSGLLTGQIINVDGGWTAW